MITAISHILYDLGNTLLYLNAPWQQVFADGLEGFRITAAAAGIPVNPETLASTFHRNMDNYYAQREEDFIERTSACILEETLAKLGIPSPPNDLVNALLSAFYARTQQHWIPGPETEAVLTALAQRGFRQAILSNAAHDADVQYLVDKAGFRGTLDFALSSAAIGYRKPHPAAFQAALNRWGALPGQVLMVGDTLNADILGAINSGIRCVWTRQHLFDLPKNAPRTLQPDYEINRLAELLNLLENT